MRANQKQEIPCLVEARLRGSSILVFLAAAIAALGIHALPAHTARTAATKWRSECELNVFLAVNANEERWDVANLLADADVPLTDEGTSVVDGLGKAKLEDLGLEAALHDLGAGQTQDVIELPFVLQEQTHTHHAAQQCVSLEHACLVLLIKREQVPGRSANPGKSVIDTPHLTLVLQAVLAHDFHLTVKTLLLEWPLRLTERLGHIVVAFLTHGLFCFGSCVPLPLIL